MAPAVDTQLKKPFHTQFHQIEGRIEGRVKRLTSGLVELVADGNRRKSLQFNHESVQDYISNRGVSFLELNTGAHLDNNVIGRVHHLISVACVRYLGAAAAEPDGLMTVRNCPFLRYAARNSMEHARISEYTGMQISDLIEITEWPSNKVWALWERTNRTYSYPRIPQHITLQHVSSMHGLYSVLTKLIPRCKEKKSSDWSQLWTRLGLPKKLEFDHRSIDVKDTLRRTPLSYASERGHDRIVRLLLDTKRVDVNSHDERKRTSLFYAAQGGHLAIVKTLLDVEDLDVISADDSHDTLLPKAARQGYLEVVKLLFHIAKAKLDNISFFDAALGGHKASVELFLSTGDINVNAIDHHGVSGLAFYGRCRTAIQAAAVGSNVEVVQLLIDKGAVVNSTRSIRPTALQIAAEIGAADVVELLLGAGADVNATPGEMSYTALQVAAKNGNIEVVERLLAAGANVNTAAADLYGRTAIETAAENGNIEVVERILARGADVNAEVARYGIALQAAARYGHLEVVERLLVAGANFDISKERLDKLVRWRDSTK